MSRIAFILVLLACFAVVGYGQQRPLITEDVDIIPPGSIRIEAGIDFMQGAKYTVSGIRGDLTRVGVIGVNFGMGPNVEFQIEGVRIPVASIDHLIASKRTGRLQDAADIEVLQEIKRLRR